MSELKDATYVLDIISKIRQSNLYKRGSLLKLEKMKKLKNIIILGGSGRIGSAISKYLELKGYDVYVIDKVKNKYLNKKINNM